MNEVIGTDQSSMVESHLGVTVNLSHGDVHVYFTHSVRDAATFIKVERDATSDDQGRYRDSAGAPRAGEDVGRAGSG